MRQKEKTKKILKNVAATFPFLSIAAHEVVHGKVSQESYTPTVYLLLYELRQSSFLRITLGWLSFLEKGNKRSLAIVVVVAVTGDSSMVTS